MDFKGSGKRLGPADLERAAETLSAPLAVVKAVIEVEAGSSGFDRRRRPKILFEPHIFYRELGAGLKREAAEEQSLAYRKWGAKPYPKKMDDRYRQIEAAMRIDPVMALRSASWGLPQIMGFNHSVAGYPSVFDMVEDMKVGEGNQIQAFVRLLLAWELDDELRRLKWLEFSLAYNGPKAEEHGYPERLQRAYEKHAAVPPPPPKKRRRKKPTKRKKAKKKKTPILTGAGLF